MPVTRAYPKRLEQPNGLQAHAMRRFEQIGDPGGECREGNEANEGGGKENAGVFFAISFILCFLCYLLFNIPDDLEDLQPPTCTMEKFNRKA